MADDRDPSIFAPETLLSPPPPPQGDPTIFDPVGHFAQTKARSGGDWSEVAPVLKQAGLDTPQAEQQFRLEKRRGYESQRAETAQEFVATRALPFASAIGNTAREIRYKRVMDQIGKGESPSDDDIEFAARHEHLAQFKAERQKTLLGSLAEAGAGIPALMGEAMTARAGSTAVLGAERIAQLGTAGKVGLSLAETPAMPSLYAEGAAQDATQKGGEWTDLKNIGPRMAMAALQNVVLGRLQGNAAKSTVPTQAGKVAYAGGLGVVEQGLADSAASVADEFLPERLQTKTRYGTLGELGRGDISKASTHATVQALTFSAFAAMHGRAADPAETIGPALDSLAKKGMSKEKAAEAVNDAVEGKAEPPTEAVKNHVETVNEATRPLDDEAGPVKVKARGEGGTYYRDAENFYKVPENPAHLASEPAAAEAMRLLGNRTVEVSPAEVRGEAALKSPHLGVHRGLDKSPHAAMGQEELARLGLSEWVVHAADRNGRNYVTVGEGGHPDLFGIDYAEAWHPGTFRDPNGAVGPSHSDAYRQFAIEPVHLSDNLVREVVAKGPELERLAAEGTKGLGPDAQAEAVALVRQKIAFLKSRLGKPTTLSHLPTFEGLKPEAGAELPKAPAAETGNKPPAEAPVEPPKPTELPGSPEIAPGSPQRAPEPGVASGPSEVPIVDSGASGRVARAPGELSDRERAVLDGLAVHGADGGGQRVADELGVTRERVRQIKNEALKKLGKTLEEYKAEAAEGKRNRALAMIERGETVDPSELHNVPREAAKIVSGHERKVTSSIEIENYWGKQIKALLKEIDRAGDSLDPVRSQALFAEVARLQRAQEERTPKPRRKPPGVQEEAPQPEPAAGGYAETPGAGGGFFRFPWQKRPAPPPGLGGTPAAAPGPSGVADEVRTLLAPATRSDAAKLGGNVVRANNAILAHKKAVAEAALKAGADYFDDLVTKAAGDEAKLKDLFLAFTDPIQSGAIGQMGPEMKGMAEAVRKLYDERTAAVTSRKLIDGSKLIDNYVTQLWADPKRPDATPEEIGRALSGRRPLAGAEGFKKERFYDTYRDGIEAGLVPRDWNPVRTLLAGLHQIDKSVMAHDTVQELKENGLWEFVRLGGERKPGWEHINDKIATVFAPPETKVKEYFDKQQMEGLEKFAESLGIDVQTARDSADVVRRGVAGGLPPPVGKKGGTLGASVGDAVIRRFGTPEEVLAHEIGHQLDTKYDMARGLQAPGLASEMESLAKLRASGRVSPEYAAYLQAPGERAANLVTAYLHAPELLRKVAPESAEWFEALLSSHKELQPLRDVKPSLELAERDQMMRLAGPMLTGHFTTPGEVATLLNNHLSPSLHGRSQIYAAVRHAANTLNGFQLGFSAFHAGFVTMDAQVSAVALGFKQISRGDFAAGLKSVAVGSVPGLPPVLAFLRGTKVGREYFAPGSQGAEVAGLVELLEQAGGRAKMDAFHGGDRVEAFRKALRAVQLGNVGKLPHALLNAIPALSEAIQKPVMEVLVPRMKMGVFADLARYELEKNPNMTREEFRDSLGKSWDSVENRLGQMTYDNLFWNRTFKDLLMVGVRSVGWNVGTVRELAGGVRDIPRAVRDVPAGRGVSDRLAYAAALPMVTAMWGAMYGYLFGQPPQELKDYFFPRTGRTRKDGSADRVSLPSYMRDVAALTNRADEGPVRVVSNAWEMAKHKTNPFAGLTAEMLENKDFYGKAIYNPGDTSVQKARDLAAHVLKSFEPLAVRSYNQQDEQHAPLGQKLQGFIGITPAPSNVVHTAEEQRAAEAKRKVTLTPIGKLEQERKKQAAGRK